MATLPAIVTGSLTQADSVVSFDASDSDTVVFQITGTWAGTISFETSVDGTNYVAVSFLASSATNFSTFPVSTTGNGVFLPSRNTVAGQSFMRLRMSSYTSGTAVVTVRLARSAK